MEDMEEELKPILPFLPVVVRSGSLYWPSQAVETLEHLSKGPEQSRVNSGQSLTEAMSDLRRSLSLFPLNQYAAEGYALFFDEIISKEDSDKWFGEVLPALAKLLLRLPTLLQDHYQNANKLIPSLQTGLRLLHSQQPGIVFLTQELISALLGCSLLCLFPVKDRSAKHLPKINFDDLFNTLYDSYNQKQENKIWCIIHYFEKITSHMPMGLVSFERKVLPVQHSPLSISYPTTEFWSNSVTPLCHFEVHRSGLIEDQSSGALEVDFANKYIGGGALNRGCVQEEIRFMINPELIASMLFMPSMADNEAIEIVGAERFSNYTGYASSFRFAGDFVDAKDVDSLGRRKTRIIAIDALCSPGMKQYKPELLLRETNKAFCGFLHHSKYQQYKTLIQEHKGEKSDSDEIQCLDCEDDIGIATGNWGCGAFGGDPEVKTIIQWLAASQAKRPFISYYTFGTKALDNLDEVSKWIVVHEWTVGDVWNLLAEYSLQRLKGETTGDVGFFTWLLPSLLDPSQTMMDLCD